MKKAWANPNIINHKTTKNGKTSFATPIIIIKYFPNDGNTRKNNKNLKFNKKLESDIIQRDGFVSDLIQNIDVIIGKEYAPISIKYNLLIKKKQIGHIYDSYKLLTNYIPKIC